MRLPIPHRMLGRGVVPLPGARISYCKQGTAKTSANPFRVVQVRRLPYSCLPYLSSRFLVLFSARTRRLRFASRARVSGGCVLTCLGHNCSVRADPRKRAARNVGGGPHQGGTCDWQFGPFRQPAFFLRRQKPVARRSHPAVNKPTWPRPSYDCECRFLSAPTSCVDNKRTELCQAVTEDCDQDHR